tara:strand:- start:580 stop:849 length:270 start_codon:yes stop_codon:yes gene_type:complete
MEKTITINRASAEALLHVANEVLGTTNATGPDNLERAEVIVKNNVRRNLTEAVYQLEKSLYEIDACEGSGKTEAKENDRSFSKENWIAR